MPTQPPPRRRFQFSLRTLMIGIALLAVACAYVGWQATIVSVRVKILAEFRDPPHIIKWHTLHLGDKSQAPGLLRRWLGDKEVGSLFFAKRDDAERHHELFPEARIEVVDSSS
jgi:hypothetical protein